jgi:ATP-dependent RNA helicase DeaD
VAITLVEPREHHALRNIERLTNHKIEIAKVPTVADLHARRLELTLASLREGLVADDNEHFRVVVDALSNDYDPVQIAMAAVKLYHESTVGDGDEGEIEVVSHAPAPSRPRGPPRSRFASDMARVFIGAGREAGMRPQDLVGAIANEAGVPGSRIGAIQITDRYSIVEVPEEVAEQVIGALGKSTLRGKKVPVRRDKAN